MRLSLSVFLLALPLAAWAQTPLAGPGPSSPRASESAAPLTLNAALELALGANPDLSAAGRELEALDATITQAQARPNPELSALIEDTRRETRTTTLQLNQPIELGGKRGARIEAAERGRDAASLELEAKRAEIRAAVTAAFFDVLVAQERLRLAQAPVAIAPLAFGSLADRTPGVELFQIVQTAPTTLRVRLHAMAGTDPDRVWQAVQGEIARLLADHKLGHVAVERAEEPPQQSPGGKVRMVIRQGH
ncbi:MAG: TolC family protein [Thiobacillus sp.]